MIKLVSLPQLLGDRQICRSVHYLALTPYARNNYNLVAATSSLCQGARYVKLLNPLNKSGNQYYGQNSKLVAGKDVQLKHT